MWDWEIKIVNVKRFSEGGYLRVEEVVVLIDNRIEFTYRLDGNNNPELVRKTRYDVSILTSDTFFIPPLVEEKVRKIVWAIFSEKRPIKNENSKNNSEKNNSENYFDQDFIQGELF